MLCEDSKGGFLFWQKFNDILLNKYFDVVDHSGGFGGLPLKVQDAIIDGACFIFVAIDEVPKSVMTIKRVKDLLIENHVEHTITDYWCIEEVLLSFIHLPTWTKSEQGLVDIWHSVYHTVIGGADARVSADIQNALIHITGGRHVEKEKFYKRLYGTMVNTKPAQFSLVKHQEGTDTNTSCWFNNCSPVMIRNGCKECCGIPDEMTRAFERLLCLYKNSLFGSREFGKMLHKTLNTIKE